MNTLNKTKESITTSVMINAPVMETLVATKHSLKVSTIVQNIKYSND